MSQSTWAEKKTAPLKKAGPVTPTVSFDDGNCPIQTQREVVFSLVVGIALEGRSLIPQALAISGPYNQLALGTEEIQPQASNLETVIKPLASKAPESERKLKRLALDLVETNLGF